jgi:phenylpyruvate tautomerase PptA (4-oxalocrotonate tautomerase family)
LLEITFISGRPREQRLKLLKVLNDAVVSAAGISPDNLVIMLNETPGENISFGRELAQRAHIPVATDSGGGPVRLRSHPNR